jgi:hypothetical protein
MRKIRESIALDLYVERFGLTGSEPE